MKAAIIHFEPVFSKFDQSLFLHKVLQKSYIEIKDKDVSFPIYRVPVYEKKPSQKAIRVFCEFLKKEQIQKIIVTNELKKMPIVLDALKQHFSFFTGEIIINCRISDILRKYAASKNCSLASSTLCLETESVAKAKQMIEKVYKQVKKIKIKTKHPEAFSELCEYLLTEYGLFVATTDEKEKTDLCVELDSMLPNQGELNLSLDENRCSRILFSCKKNYKSFEKLVELNQMSLEFLIYLQYGKLTEQSVLQFFKSHSVKISKIL